MSYHHSMDSAYNEWSDYVHVHHFRQPICFYNVFLSDVGHSLTSRGYYPYYKKRSYSQTSSSYLIWTEGTNKKDYCAVEGRGMLNFAKTSLIKHLIQCKIDNFKASCDFSIYIVMKETRRAE